VAAATPTLSPKAGGGHDSNLARTIDGGTNHEARKGTMFKSIAVTAAVGAAAAAVGFAGPSNAGDTPGATRGSVSAVSAWVNIATDAAGLHIKLDTVPLADGQAAGKPLAWMVTSDNTVVHYSVDGPGASERVPVRFAGHTGAHVVRIYKNGVLVFHQTVRTGAPR
jgi:hypothetical protein